MINTLDELISKLAELRGRFPGHTAIAIDDMDTAWHIRIHTVCPSNRYPDRLLISGRSYSKEDKLPEP